MCYSLPPLVSVDDVNRFSHHLHYDAAVEDGDADVGGNDLGVALNDCGEYDLCWHGNLTK